jgi:hypothetical protein
MMGAAEIHETGQLGLTAIGPVLDVVGIEIAPMGAAGKAAAGIAGIERAADGGRNGAGFAPHVERLTVFGLEEANQAGIAGEPAYGLGG